MRLGIGSYTYTWSIGVPGYPSPTKPLDTEALVDEAARLGVSVVQVCDNIPLAEAPPQSLERLAARARSRGILLETGTRGTQPAHLRRYLQVSVALGARLVRSLITGTIPDAEGEIREVMPEFEEAGVVLALENYEKHPVGELAEMILRVDSPFLGACLDTVNSFGALETPQQAAAALLPLAACLHVKDFDIVRADHRMGFSIVGTPAGEGRLDIPGLIRSVRGNGRDCNAILELWPPFAGTVDQTAAREREWAEQSIRHLRRYIE
jgi:sugar phosphate isomerase/epimerase